MNRTFLLVALACAACGGTHDSVGASKADAGAKAGAAPVASSTTAHSGSRVAADDLLVGQRAPDFAAKSQDGKTVRLSDFAGKRVVLYFYPRDETPGCTAEACALRDSFNEISEAGAVVLGVSADDPKSHESFAKHHELPFALLSDSDGAIARSFSVPAPGGRTARQTFVIDPNGRVEKVYRRVNVAVHASEILSDVRAPSAHGS